MRPSTVPTQNESVLERVKIRTIYIRDLAKLEGDKGNFQKRFKEYIRQKRKEGIEIQRTQAGFNVTRKWRFKRTSIQNESLLNKTMYIRPRGISLERFLETSKYRSTIESRHLNASVVENRIKCTDKGKENVPKLSKLDKYIRENFPMQCKPMQPPTPFHGRPKCNLNVPLRRKEYLQIYSKKIV